MSNERLYKMSFGSVYPLYLKKIEKKGRTKNELDEVISWLTSYDKTELMQIVNNGADFESFFANAPKMNPARSLITGVICGVRVEEIKEPLMREIRYLDKLVDELAKGKPLEKICRTTQ